MSIFTIGWIIWAVYFVTLEGIALFNKTTGDTLSEHVWAWLKGKKAANSVPIPKLINNKEIIFMLHPPPIRTSGLNHWTWRTFVVGAFLIWLFLHLTFGLFAG